LKIMIEYFRARQIQSDINEHLRILCKYAQRCDSIMECGVRNIVSTWAFLHGIKRCGKPVLIGVDLNTPPKEKLELVAALAKQTGVLYKFYQQSDLECPLESVDCVFLDTWHVYGQLKRELNRIHSFANKYIIIHDTTIDEWIGETVRMGWNADEQSKETAMPVDEIKKGLWPAIEEFLQYDLDWKLEKRFTNCNGLTILKRISSMPDLPR